MSLSSYQRTIKEVFTDMLPNNWEVDTVIRMSPIAAEYIIDVRFRREIVAPFDNTEDQTLINAIQRLYGEFQDSDFIKYYTKASIQQMEKLKAEIEELKKYKNYYELTAGSSTLKVPHE